MLGKLYTIGSDTGGGQHQTHDKSRNVTGQNADQDRGRAEEARGPMLEDQNDHQNEQGQQQIFHGAEVFCAVAAAKGIDAHRNQRKTDGKYNRTGDDRRENLRRGLRKKPSTLSKMPPMMDAPIMAP